MSETRHVMNINEEQRKRGALAMWTVYDRPRDCPDRYVARCFAVKGGSTPTEHIIASHSLQRLRMVLNAAGMACVNRDKRDDPKIVETWI